MATGSLPTPITGIQDIDGLFGGVKWNANNVTFNFPTDASYYTSNGAYGGAFNHPSDFLAVSESFKSMVRSALAEFSTVTNLTFTEVGAADLSANTSIGRTGVIGGFSGYGYYPGSAQRSGDVWFAKTTQQVGDLEVHGRGTWRLVMHELGHALGLKHAHEGGGPANIAVTPEHDYSDFTVMSYRRTPGGATNESGQETFGNPQSLMMLDIQALQTMYGANYNHNNGNTTYRWDPVTGQKFVNGVGQDTPGANRIYETIWDGGGTDTFDLSNYTSALTIDLTPGGHSTFSDAQLAILNTASSFKSLGNVFNALLFNNDARSLIENVVGGSGADAISGNQANNSLSGGGGNDSISGGAGSDSLYGGDGADTLRGGADGDYLNGGNGGGSAGDSLYGEEGDDTLSGTLNAAAYLDGGNGNDSLYGNFAGSVLHGGDGADFLSGSTGGNSLYGDAGEDVVVANSGADYIEGGVGHDTLYGGSGGDSIYGQDGFDALYGQDGSDYLFGGNGNDYVGGGDGGDFMQGDSGDDSMDGGVVADYMDGGDGNDSMYGGDGGDVMHGMGGADYLAGQNGSDTMFGEAGNDTLDGGNDGSADYLDGGAGSDTYVFGAGFGGDIVGSFDDGATGDQDVIFFSTSIFANFAAVQAAMTQVTVGPNDYTVFISKGSNVLELRHTNIGQLGADDFAFFSSVS